MEDIIIIMGIPHTNRRDGMKKISAKIISKKDDNFESEDFFTSENKPSKKTNKILKTFAIAIFSILMVSAALFGYFSINQYIEREKAIAFNEGVDVGWVIGKKHGDEYGDQRVDEVYDEIELIYGYSRMDIIFDHMDYNKEHGINMLSESEQGKRSLELMEENRKQREKWYAERDRYKKIVP